MRYNKEEILRYAEKIEEYEFNVDNVIMLHTTACNMAGAITNQLAYLLTREFVKEGLDSDKAFEVAFDVLNVLTRLYILYGMGLARRYDDTEFEVKYEQFADQIKRMSKFIVKCLGDGK